MALGLATIGAQAATITCSGPPGLRVLSIDTTLAGSCFGRGTGNLGDPALEALIGGGVTVIDRDNANNNGGSLIITGVGSQTDGTWSFSGSGAISYLYFHFGNGPGNPADDPDFFIFALTTPTGAGSGTWTAGGAGARWNGLSNIALLSKDDGGKVPEPASLALIGLAVLGLASVRRRRS